VSNLVKVFPSLANRPLHLTGESYAGAYIVSVIVSHHPLTHSCHAIQPYITKAYFSLPSPPTKLVKIAIGDGAIGIGTEFTDAPVVEIIETFPQLIGYDPEVFNYFATQSVSNIVRPTFCVLLTLGTADPICAGTTSI
jgi:carboxypeptidase D